MRNLIALPLHPGRRVRSGAAVRPRHPPRHRLRRHRHAGPRGGRGRPGRSHRRARRSERSAGSAGDRRDRTCGRARLHRHAQPLRDGADCRRPIAGHDSPGRHARGVRRKLDGADHRRDEERPCKSARATSSSRSRGRTLGEYPRLARHARRLDQRRVVCQRRDRTRQRDRLRQPAADARRARAHARRTCARPWTRAPWV